MMDDSQNSINSFWNASAYNDTKNSTGYGNDSDYPSMEAGYIDIINAANVINKYYLWVVLAFGFPGNLATVVTISRMRNLGAFAFYVVSLAIMDNLALVVKILVYQLINIRNMNTDSCKVLTYAGTCLSSFANWILVMMAVERLIAVRYPFRIQNCVGFKKSALALTVTGFVIAGIYAPIVWLSTYDDTYLICSFIDLAPQIMKALHWANKSLYAFIPFIVLVFCNVLIAKEIRTSFRLRSALRNTTILTVKPRCCDASLQRQIMLMLFATTFVFMVLLFPICAFSIADTSWDAALFTRSYALKHLIYQLVYVLCDSTHAINFYLYFLSARKFRKSCPRFPECISLNPRQVTL